MAIHITLRSSLFDDSPEQEVRVRTDLTIAQLITEIRREYDLAEGEYHLVAEPGAQVLDPTQTLQALGIRTGAMLVFGISESPRESSGAKKTGACLRSSTGIVFELKRQPALIGRPNARAGLTSEKLDVDLSALDPERTSSRPHAQISCIDGHYYLESLRDDNRAYVNEQPVPTNSPHRLTSGEWLRFGAVRMQFLLEDRD